jgi:hypothetical protein
MGYNPTTWQDRNVATPRDFTITKSGGGAISSGDIATMTPNPGTITATGVAPNKLRMDNLDEGVESLYNGDGLYIITTGSANTYVATFTTAYTAYTTGLTLRIKFNLENTTTSTINVDTLGAKTIKKVTGAGIEVLEAGDIVADGVYIIVYDGVEDAFIVSNQFKVKPMNQVFTSSGTFTAPFTGNYEVTVTGGGGSPGYVSTGGGESGGAAGGTAIKVVSLTKGDAVSVTIGIGGITPVSTAFGVTGGTTSFGGYCSATGGTGGTYAPNAMVRGRAGGIGVDGTPAGNFLSINGGEGGWSVDYNSPYNYGGSGFFGGEGSYGSGGGYRIDGNAGVCIVKWMEG